jgi:biotin operon repressor
MIRGGGPLDRAYLARKYDALVAPHINTEETMDRLEAELHPDKQPQQGGGTVISSDRLASMLGITREVLLKRIEQGKNHPPYFRKGRGYFFKLAEVLSWERKEIARKGNGSVD